MSHWDLTLPPFSTSITNEGVGLREWLLDFPAVMRRDRRRSAPLTSHSNDQDRHLKSPAAGKLPSGQWNHFNTVKTDASSQDQVFQIRPYTQLSIF